MGEAGRQGSRRIQEEGSRRKVETCSRTTVMHKRGRKSAGDSGTCSHRHPQQRTKDHRHRAWVDTRAGEQQMLDVTPPVCARISSTNTSVRLVQFAFAEETCMGLTGSTTLPSDSPGG